MCLCLFSCTVPVVGFKVLRLIVSEGAGSVGVVITSDSTVTDNTLELFYANDTALGTNLCLSFSL